jgi:hypothetical protein
LPRILCRLFRNAAPARNFVEHDGREYAIVSGIEKPGSESFIDVAVKVNGVEKAIARYGVVLIRISLQ